MEIYHTVVCDNCEYEHVSYDTTFDIDDALDLIWKCQICDTDLCSNCRENCSHCEIDLCDNCINGDGYCEKCESKFCDKCGIIDSHLDSETDHEFKEQYAKLCYDCLVELLETKEPIKESA